MPDLLHNKHFSLADARRILAEITPLVEELVSLKQKLDDRGYDVYRHQYFGGSGPNGEKVFPPEVERLVEVSQEIESKGILVKDLDQGLIDFPHLRDNEEEVYLCWKLGEEAIGYWHRIPDGFAGRKGIQEL
jgi:hypothetical protein